LLKTEFASPGLDLLRKFFRVRVQDRQYNQARDF
jgi:hypothetical protein